MWLKKHGAKVQRNLHPHNPQMLVLLAYSPAATAWRRSLFCLTARWWCLCLLKLGIGALEGGSARDGAGFKAQLEPLHALFRRAGVFVHVVLAHLVYLGDELARLFGGDALLADYPGHAVLHGGLDEDAQVVGVMAEHVESAGVTGA